MTMKIFCCLLLFFWAASNIEASRRWCFYTNWAQYRKGDARFLPENIDANLCTHISYAFASLKNGKLAHFEWNDDDTRYQQGMYKRVNKMKLQNPALKTLLAVGGWNIGSLPFSHMVATKQTRQDFITSTVSFLRSRNFDGLDICWEYPTRRESPKEDKERFGLLLKELKAAFEDDANTRNLPRLILGITVGVDDDLIDQAYDIKAINSSVDAVSLLTYDFYNTVNAEAALHTSALHAGNVTVGTDKTKNVEYVANHWVNLGIPKKLINIGIVLYAHSYRLKVPNTMGEGAATTGAGPATKVTGLAGFLAYYEVCDMIDLGAQVKFIEDRGVPYLVLGNQWVAYENERSVSLKAKFAVDNGFGGVMVWSFDVDDFTGVCHSNGNYPLLRSIYNAMKKS